MINGMIYIGKHQTQNLDDDYMGSGKLLQRAIRKYGLEKFKKEILFVFETESEMNTKEAELVNEAFVSRDDTYNLCFGGQGGWSYVNKEILTSDHRKIAGSKGGKAFARNCAEKRKLFPKEKKLGPGKGSHFKGNNRQTGKMWITNGVENRKIFPHEIIPDGWYKGGRIKQIRISRKH